MISGIVPNRGILESVGKSLGFRAHSEGFGSYGSRLGYRVWDFGFLGLGV